MRSKKRIYWVARHDLTEEQIEAIKEVHGDVEIIHEDVRFTGARGLYDFIQEHQDGYVYSVASGIHYLFAFDKRAEFFIFEPYHNQFDGPNMKAIWHCKDVGLAKVWEDEKSYEYMG